MSPSDPELGRGPAHPPRVESSLLARMKRPDKLNREVSVRDEPGGRGNDQPDGLRGRGSVVCALPGASEERSCDLHDAVHAEDRSERLDEHARVREGHGDQRLGYGSFLRHAHGRSGKLSRIEPQP